MLLRPRARVHALLQRLGSSAGFAYATLALLQLTVVFGMWSYRDLTAGDTAGYYTRAWAWHHGQTDIVWSPLYVAFYGLMLRFSSDAYVVTILHRLVIVFVVALLALALNYLDETVLADPAAQSFLDNARLEGWETVTRIQTPAAHWRLLERGRGPGG
jgi:hypothetical protein